MKMNTDNTVYTVGHSNHPIEYFAEIIQEHSINCIIDVRSIPASAYSPQFNQEPLQNYLKRININYLHFAEEFGARHTNPKLLDEYGKVDFEKVRNSEKFLSGIERLKTGLSKGYNISLMCSEAEPFDCHRFSMISYYLARNGFNIFHILKDKSLISNQELEEKLLKRYKKQIPQTNLFEVFTPQQQLNLAYRLRNQEVAYDTQRI